MAVLVINILIFLIFNIDQYWSDFINFRANKKDLILITDHDFQSHYRLFELKNTVSVDKSYLVLINVTE